MDKYEANWNLKFRCNLKAAHKTQSFDKSKSIQNYPKLFEIIQNYPKITIYRKRNEVVSFISLIIQTETASE